MEYRVDQLAARAGVSVDTVRFYQSRGLLPGPRREGRVAWYGHEHLERLASIKRLQAKGLTLAAVKRFLAGELSAPDEDLASAVLTADTRSGELLTAEELSERSGIPVPLLEAAAREGLLIPAAEGERRFTDDDVAVADAGLRLLERGLPLGDLLGLARHHHAAVVATAEQAVQMFDEHVRIPLRKAGLSDEEAARRLVEAFDDLLPATVALVAHHFRRTLLAMARAHIEKVGDEAELAAVEAVTTTTAGSAGRRGGLPS